MRAPFLHFALVLFLAAPTGEGNGQPPQPTEDRGGFVASASSYAPFWGDVYCADSGSAQVSFVPAAGGGTYLKVQHIREKARGGCGPSRVMSAYIETLKFPTLVPPVG